MSSVALTKFAERCVQNCIKPLLRILSLNANDQVLDLNAAALWSTVATSHHFFEKVIKVKADVAAGHIVFPPTSTMVRRVAWRAVKGAVVGRSS